MKDIKKTLGQSWEFVVSRNGWLCVTLLVVMQLVVASSTLWILRLIHAVQAGEPFGSWLILFLSSLFLPYVPGAFSVEVLCRWQFEATKKWIDQFIRNHQRRTGLWTSVVEKEKRLAALSQEGQAVYQNFTQYLHRFFSCTFNVLFNLLVLSFLVEWKFLLGYIISFLATLGVLRLFNPKLGAMAYQAQTARVALGRSVLRSWDNVLLGNQYNFSIWKGIYEPRFQNAARQTFRSISYKQRFSILLAFFTLAPCFLIVVHSMWVHADQPLVLSSIVVTLPRLFLILGFTYEIVELFLEWAIQTGKLKGLDQLLGEVHEGRLEARIHWSALNFSANGGRFDSHHYTNVASFAEALPTTGRVVLRGPNGSGKSSLLLSLKERLGERAFYLPAESQLEFRRQRDSRSTGETLRDRLWEITGEVPADVLLLDEWDANLDPQNRRNLSSLLDKLATHKLIVEVRHHHNDQL